MPKSSTKTNNKSIYIVTCVGGADAVINVSIFKTEEEAIANALQSAYFDVCSDDTTKLFIAVEDFETGPGIIVKSEDGAHIFVYQIIRKEV